MRKSTKNELNKLRELFWFLVDGKKCAVCKLPFQSERDFRSGRHGDSKGRPLDVAITIDHVDGDHWNNERGNHRLMHKDCHQRWTANRAQRKGGRFSK